MGSEGTKLLVNKKRRRTNTVGIGNMDWPDKIIGLLPLPPHFSCFLSSHVSPESHLAIGPCLTSFRRPR